MSDLPEGMVLDTEAKRLAGIRFLNARLPTKRLIAQGVLRSSDGRVLLCELTYKRDWDLPGGVVDPGESPAVCVVREVEEELGLDVVVHSLLAVNWLPPYRGWDDALLCLFDLGVVESAILDDATLLRREIKAAHWVGLDDLADHVAPYTAAMLTEVLPGVTEGGPVSTAYIEDSRRVEFGDAGAGGE
ncbi:MAG: NUDIX domain-containing protein [Dermatophilaceae bacterium]|nr:NUDIX domain-containing protein [Intrasporangiaceae bacterium]